MGSLLITLFVTNLLSSVRVREIILKTVQLVVIKLRGFIFVSSCKVATQLRFLVCTADSLIATSEKHYVETVGAS